MRPLPLTTYFHYLITESPFDGRCHYRFDHHPAVVPPSSGTQGCLPCQSCRQSAGQLLRLGCWRYAHGACSCRYPHLRLRHLQQHSPVGYCAFAQGRSSPGACAEGWNWYRHCHADVRVASSLPGRHLQHASGWFQDRYARQDRSGLGCPSDQDQDPDLYEHP